MSLNRTVAVKMILSGQLASAADVQRFRAEAESAANLNHPNIVAIHEIGQHDGQHYFSMDYVEGQNLAEFVGQKPLPPKQAANYLKTIAEAIHYAHQRGILHRDLKPSNVLIDQSDQPRITDFGLAKQMKRDSDLTLSGQVLGSPNFMPPEQAAGKRAQIGPQSEVYALGAILYYLVTARPPFAAESITETLQQVVNNEPPSPRLLNPGVPRDLETICLKCLEKEPSGRYATARELAEELDRFINGEPVQARPVGALGKAWRWCQRRPALAAALSSILILVLIVGIGSPIAAFRINRERQRAERTATEEARQRQRAQEALTRIEIERAENLFAADSSSRALAYLARLLRQQPANRVVAERLLNALTLRNFCLPTVSPLEHNTVFPSAAYPRADDQSPLAAFVRGGGAIRCGQFSPDGQRVLTASKDGTARIWDSSTGLPACEPLRHRSTVTYAQFSADGRRVVTASLDHTARVWDAQTGRPATAPLQHEGPVLYAELSHDGRKVITASEDRTVRFWDADTGQPVLNPITNKAAVYFATFSPDGTQALTASVDDTARIWSLSDGAELASFRHYLNTEPYPFPAFSPNGQQLATLWYDALIWDVPRTNLPAARLRHDADVVTVEFSPDGQWIATGSMDTVARLWDSRTGRAASTPLKHGKSVGSAHFSPDAQRVVTTSSDARIWAVRTGRPITEPIPGGSGASSAQISPDGRLVLTLGDGDGRYAWLWDLRCTQPFIASLRHDREVTRAVFSPDGQRIATASLGGTARVWDARTAQALTQPLKHGGRLSIEFSPDGKQVATSSLDNQSAQVWDAITGTPLAGPLFHSNDVVSARFSKDGRELVTASKDKTARLWALPSGRLVAQLQHAGGVQYAEFDPDARRVLTASRDGTARVWGSRDGRRLMGPLQHGGWVWGAEFSPDGQRIVTASEDKTARIWDGLTGQAVGKPLAHAEGVSSAKFSPDGQRVATAAGAALQIWDARTGEPLTPPIQHGGRINSIRFSRDGKRLIAACQDGSARVWDVATGHALSEPLRHAAQVRYAEFSPDGRYVVTASTDTTARIWELPFAPVPVPDWLPSLAEAVAGQRIDWRDMSAAVPVEELLSLKKRLGEDARDALTRRADRRGDFYNTWAEWFFAKSASRTISVSSPLRLQDYVQARVEENTLESLREAVLLSPTNSLAFARLALWVLKPAETEDPSRLSEADFLSRHALELSPNDAEVIKVRAEVSTRLAKAAKP